MHGNKKDKIKRCLENAAHTLLLFTNFSPHSLLPKLGNSRSLVACPDFFLKSRALHLSPVSFSFNTRAQQQHTATCPSSLMLKFHTGDPANTPTLNPTPSVTHSSMTWRVTPAISKQGRQTCLNVLPSKATFGACQIYILRNTFVHFNGLNENPSQHFFSLTLKSTGRPAGAGDPLTPASHHFQRQPAAQRYTLGSKLRGNASSVGPGIP